jgi:single-stranded DNA-binding protein
MTFALVNGQLFRAPEQRTSKTGKPYVTATLKVKDGEASQWWRVTAFSESAQAEIMRLAEGDSLAVQGSFKAEIYTPDGGETKLSLSIIADRVLALRQAPKERKAPKEPEASYRGGSASFNDAIPFGAA